MSFKQYMKENTTFEFTDGQLTQFDSSIESMVEDFENWVKSTINSVDDDELEALGYEDAQAMIEDGYKTFIDYVSKKIEKDARSVVDDYDSYSVKK